jgi:hypothetical protein
VRSEILGIKVIIETNENIVCFDVDDTLVIWNIPPGREKDCILFNSFGTGEWLLPHQPHIKMLKQFRARGHKVIVWSQGGAQWAAEVVKTLKLEEFVDVAMTKPKWIIDDLPASVWMQRSYLDLNGKRVKCMDAISGGWGSVHDEEDPFPNDEK